MGDDWSFGSEVEIGYGPEVLNWLWLTAGTYIYIINNGTMDKYRI